MKIKRINKVYFICKINIKLTNRDISPRRLFEGETSLISPIKDIHFRETPLKNEFENSLLNPMNIRLDFPYESIFFYNIILGLNEFSSKNYDYNNKEEFKGKSINFNEFENYKNSNLINHIQKINNYDKIYKQINNGNKNQNNLNKKICCTCTKTNCIKKYCLCYANGKFCKGCECINCLNTPKNKKEREENKINKPILNQENIICNCTKSNCLKKYCECYKMGKECGNLCRCIGCLNKININLNENENDKIINYNPYNKFMPHIICYNCPFITEYINISITNGIMKIIRNNSNNEEEIHKTPKLSNKKRMKENKNDSGNLNTCSSTINNSSRRKKKLCINKNVKTKKLLLN